MDVFVYFPPDIDLERDVIEDTLDDAIAERGEVTGGGIGDKGMNIDLDIEDDVAPEEILKVIRTALAELQAPYTKIVIAGKTFTAP
jgi:hypothetical protein